MENAPRYGIFLWNTKHPNKRRYDEIVGKDSDFVPNKKTTDFIASVYISILNINPKLAHYYAQDGITIRKNSTNFTEDIRLKISINKPTNNEKLS